MRFGFSEFGPGFSPFLAEQVQSSGFLEGFKVRFFVGRIWVCVCSKFVIYGFDPTLIEIITADELTSSTPFISIFN